MAIEDKIISELVAILQNGGNLNNLDQFFQDEYFNRVDGVVVNINYEKLRNVAEKEDTMIIYMLTPYIEEAKEKEERRKRVSVSLWERFIRYFIPNPLHDKY